MIKVNKINLHDLYEIKKKKEIRGLNVFNHILNLINIKIKEIAEHGGMSLYYKVPPVVIGFPLYDYNNCMEYLISQLKLAGLYASRLPQPQQNLLYISWKLQDLSSTAKSRLLLE
jgi:hypothetical protein